VCVSCLSLVPSPTLSPTDPVPRGLLRKGKERGRREKGDLGWEREGGGGGGRVDERERETRVMAMMGAPRAFTVA